MAMPSLLPLIAPNEREIAQIAYQRVMSGLDLPGVRTFENVNKTGERLTVLTVDSIIEWNGEPAMQIIVVDLSRQMAMQSQLQASEERYRELVDGSIQGIVVHKNFQPLFCNQAYATMFGFADSDALIAAGSMLPRINPSHQAQAWEDNHVLLSGECAFIKTEAEGLREDALPVWLSLLSRPVLWNGERVVQVTAMDITEQYQLRERLEYQANFDGLTNLLNRRALAEHLDQQVRIACTQEAPLSCLLIDVDNFKAINDTCGHQAGDKVLQQFALCCQRVTRQSDFIGRWGGEEFVLVLPHTPVAQAQPIAERLCRSIAELAVYFDAHAIMFTVSIGVASITPEIRTVDALVGKADEALYAAKHRGKGQVVVCE
ncbi:sensor domain-containing diguanylate cyclase [Photobacterium japonica]|uniref:sensor domain-containing diguanylate cyclase n=1 Tax=Photobacterium japonica TaxID=2910235 RepID=UPI003D0D6D0A